MNAERVDIGHGVFIAPCHYPADGVDPALAGKLAGFDYWHPCRDEKLTIGFIPVDDNRGWRVEQREPLTLTPSMLCHVCGHHGFVRSGKWIPA